MDEASPSMSPTDCSLCRLISAAEVTPLKIAGNERATATLHDDWALPGHGMLVSSRHVENFSDLDSEDATEFVAMYQRFERALLEVFEADRIILLKLGLAVPHLHWQSLPGPPIHHAPADLPGLRHRPGRGAG